MNIRKKNLNYGQYCTLLWYYLGYTHCSVLARCQLSRDRTSKGKLLGTGTNARSCAICNWRNRGRFVRTESSSNKCMPMFQFKLRYSRFCRLDKVAKKAVRSDGVGKKVLPSESLRSCVIPPRAVVRRVMDVLLAWMVSALRLAGAWRWSKKWYPRYGYRQLKKGKDTCAANFTNWGMS